MEMKNGDSENDPKITSSESTNREKYELIIIIILVIVSVILLTLVLCFALKESDVCVTKDCALTAATLLLAMDTTVEPCEDFYEFACGDFIRKNPVPEGKINFRSKDLFHRNFNLQLKDLIEGHDSHGEPNIVFKIQEMYHVCINTTYQPEEELAAFRNFTLDVLNWPLTEGQKWKPKYDTITDFILHWEEKGLDNELFPIWIHKDFENPSKLTVSIRAYNLTKSVAMTKEELEKLLEGDRDQKMAGKAAKARIKLFHQVIQLLGNKDTDSVEQDFQMMIDLAQYAQQLSIQMESNGSTTETVTIQELTDMTGNKIDWLKILNKLMRNLYTFNKDDIIKIDNPVFFTIFPLLLKKFPLRVFANVNGWETIFPEWLKLAGSLMDSALEEYKTTVDTDDDSTGSTESLEQKQRWYYCLDMVQELTPMVVTRMFINRYIDRNDKASADEMILWIQKAYKKRIQQSTWLDEETKKNALKKADAIRRYVAYPDFIFDDEALEKEYTDFPEVQSTHFSNVLEFEMQRQLKSISQLVKEETEQEWFFNPLIVNAFYSPEGNSIWFPSGILQLPYFDSSRLAAVNFGMIGSVIGHELGHAFDDGGSMFDENGKQKNWWTNKTREIFEQKTQCYIDQYDAFCPEELQGGENDTKICISGKQTLGDNLADNTGVIASFDAYKMWVKTHGKEKRLPGLQEYSPEQLFFISFGYSWCENIPVDKWVVFYEHDVHSPGKYRILGPLANSEDFRKTFNCPEGPMNRGKATCTMW